MRQKNIFKVASLGLILFMHSCNDEIGIEKSSSPEIKIEDGTVKNGRLYFPNKESLQYAYDKIKNSEDEIIANYIDSKDFIPLKPVVTEKNESKIKGQLTERIAQLKNNKRFMDSNGATNKVNNPEDVTDDIDDLEELVGDDAYEAFLNNKAEIQVANEIYKYTDVGLFIVKDNNYSKLEQYLAVRNISDDLLSPTEKVTRDNFIAGKPSGERTPITNDIDYFINKILPIDDGGGGSYGGPNDGGYNPPVEPSLATIVQNLPIGTIRKPFFGNLFGTTWVADDKYESKRRVKVKFYSQNLYLVYAVGCKVKHQYKGWTGLWRKENADKLGIGVNSISWTFSHSMNMSSPNGVPKQAYWLGSNMYTSSNGITFTFQQNQNIPSLPFASNLDGIIQFVTNFSGLTEDQLDNLFWESGWKQANKFLEGQNKKLNRVAFIVDSYNQTYIRYYDFSQIQDNQDLIERVFDWGIATPQFTYTFGGGTGNGLSATSYNFNFAQPKATAVSMYGIAKKNSAWHGVKLIAK